MPKFRKKPVAIEAVQIRAVDHNGKTPDGWAFDGRPDWLVEAIREERITDAYVPNSDFCHIDIHTKEGVMRGGPGDWIIQGVQGELYPCKPDIFEATYDRV